MAAVLMSGCMQMGGMTAGAALPELLSPPRYEGAWNLAPALDLDPSPGSVEINLEARTAEVEYLPGKKTPAWTYNGTVPGPLIEARVGDRVTVHFTNRLPDATTIHWHGVRLPASMDGTLAMQQPIAPGGSFDYSFVLRDAGLFWYHPHVRSDLQVERGLYGALLVRGSGEPEVADERVVMLDDVLLDKDGQPLGSSGMMSSMLGRQGNLLLANGHPYPVANVRPGDRQRWRIVNTANARYFRLALPGAKLTLVGSDQGLLPAPREVDDLLLAPGERADVVTVAPTATDSGLDLVTLPYDRGHGTGGQPAAPVIHLHTATQTPAALAPLQGAFAVLPDPGAPVRTRTLTLDEQMTMGGMSGSMGPTFSINGQVWPDVTPLRARVGEVEEWRIENRTAMDHPFHLHGFRFQLPDALERGWKDTVNVPMNSTVRIRVRFEENPGSWVYHCHILEHAEDGMMGLLEVAP